MPMHADAMRREWADLSPDERGQFLLTSSRARDGRAVLVAAFVAGASMQEMADGVAIPREVIESLIREETRASNVTTEARSD